MKKRLALAIALALVVFLLPGIASAAEPTDPESYYVSVILKCMQDNKYDTLREEDKPNSRGILMDLDKDGTRELILKYFPVSSRDYHSGSAVFEVWTIDGIEAVQVWEETNTYCKMWITQTDNETRLTSSYEFGGTAGSGETTTVYSTQGNSYPELYHLEVYNYRGGDSSYYSSLNQDISEQEYDKQYQQATSGIEPFVLGTEYEGYMLPDLLDLLAESSSTIIASGSCGENVTWTMDDKGTLTISGTGPMTDYYGFDSFIYEEHIHNDIIDVVIEEGVTRIGANSFYECSSIQSIVMPDSLVSIGENAFFECGMLTSAAFGEGLEIIEDGAFSWASLQNADFPVSLTSIGDYAFDRNGFTSLTFPYGVSHIGSGAFSECGALVRVELPGSLTRIEDAVFLRCENLETVIIQELVTSIGESAFRSCSSLDDVAIPSRVTRIEENAFQYCVGLHRISFRGNAPEIAPNCFEWVVANAYHPANDDTWGQDTWKGYGGILVWIEDEPYCEHSETTLMEEKQASCTEGGYTGDLYCTSCNNVVKRGEVVPAAGHQEVSLDAVAPTCTGEGKTEGKQCSVCETVIVVQTVIPATGHNYANGKCTVCKMPDPDWKEPAKEEPTRLAGSHRFETSFLAADQMKKTLGVEKFDAVVVASGMDFADALGGSYLAAEKQAPILLASGIASVDKQVKDYIITNLKEGGTVYILGGEKAIPASFAEGLDAFDVRRLAGSNRFATNLLILNEVGVGEKPILVATGLNFADCLSASATKLPILLVYGDKLLEDQVTFLEANKGRPIYIIGGTGAVSPQLEAALTDYGTVARLAGANRFDTSVMIAQTFFEAPTSAVLAYAWDFPDGLCGGPLAATMNAPLILTMAKYETQATDYIQGNSIQTGLILGGEKLIPSTSVNTIFGLK